MSQNSSDRPSPSAQPQPQSRSGARPGSPQPGKRRPLSTSLDENADRLMDEVFGDIERLLERGAQLQLESPSPSDSPPMFLSPEVATPEAPPPVADSASSSLALLPRLSPRQLDKEPDPPTDAAGEEDTDLFLELTQPEPPPEKTRSLDTLLMIIAFAALVITSGIYFFVRYHLPKTQATANVPSAAEILQAKQDAGFLNYVQRSMERIDRASKQVEPAASSGTGSPPSALPPLYVPLPPPPTATTTLPAAIPSPTARISVAPLPPAATAPAAPVVSGSSLPSPAAPATAAVVPNIAPSPTHALLGLLELGDRSAALFEINGAPQRVQVGESIGSSGWSLVSISGTEAIVRRNGEVRSVYIGQKF